MTGPIELSPKQKQFLAHACAFIATNPAQQELDQLLTLAKMLLPQPVAQMLAQRAGGETVASTDAPQLDRWLQ